MKYKLLFSLGLIVLGCAVFTAVPSEGITVGTGQFYSMPSWDQTLTANNRFIVLINMSNKAVMDKETGLVWEQSPSSIGLQSFIWEDAQSWCNLLIKGNRIGWRLPTLQELASLVDPSVSSPALPAGHPFSGVQSAAYWSATTSASDTTQAWALGFNSGGVAPLAKTTYNYVWCVRGGQGVDAQ